MSDDVQPKVPFLTQLRSFGVTYWVSNWMELVERFAYYGLRTVLPVYMVLAISDGGPEISQVQKGQIFAIWALVQSYVPIFTGSLADRYGYKLNIAIATVLKIIGYIVMCYAIPLAEVVGGASAAQLHEDGSPLIFGIFFAGAMFLALGTAIFKPGIQGLIASLMPKSASSLGWGLFYQMVNIGGFAGPLIAGYLRVLEWKHVFLVCAAGIALNFIPLFFIKEPERDPSAPHKSLATIGWETIKGLLEPRVFFFTMAFAGFWLMFYQLFDILPNFIDDWIDSRSVRDALVSISWEGAVPSVNGGNMTQEWMINVNALLISFFAFLVGYLTGKIRSLIAILIGIAISIGGIYALGMSMSGWWILGAIAFFSVGEMMASPTKMRYFAALAPPGREGQYMGYVNMTVGIGWSIGSIVAGHWYEEGGDKINLARRYLHEEGGMTRAAAEEIDRGEVLAVFERTLSVDAWEARRLLWEQYEPYDMWKLFALIGFGSLLLLIAYDRVTTAASKRPSHSFNTKGILYVRVALVPILIALFYAVLHDITWAKVTTELGALLMDKLAVGVQAVIFLLLMVASFFVKPETPEDPPPKVF